MRNAVLGGTTVAYDRRTPAAGGEPVVLLHGLGSDHHGLADLAARWPHADVITPDLPGFGSSPPLHGTHTIDAYAAAIEELCTHLGLAQVTVVGHSLGANIALVHAARHPGRVRALALLNPVTTGNGPTAWLGRAYYRLGVVLPTPLARAWLLSRPSIYLVDGVMVVSRDPEIRRRIRRMDYHSARTASPRAISEAYLSLRDTPFAELARRIEAPTLLATGSRDQIARPAAVTDLHRQIPGSRLTVIDGAGHLWPAEDPAAAGALIAGAFLDDTSPDPTPTARRSVDGAPRG